MKKFNATALMIIGLFAHSLESMGPSKAEPAKKEIIKKKRTSLERKEAKSAAKAWQNRFYESYAKVGRKNRKNLLKENRKEVQALDKALFDSLVHGEETKTIVTLLRKGANPNELIEHNGNKIPAFWGFIDGVIKNNDCDEQTINYLFFFGADLGARASDGSLILKYLFTNWPNLEKASPYSLKLLTLLLSKCMELGADLVNLDAQGNTFLDVLLQRVGDVLIVNQGKYILNFILDNIKNNAQKQEINAMIEAYNQEHIKQLREVIKPITQKELEAQKAAIETQARAQGREQEIVRIPHQPCIRGIVGEYLLGEEPKAEAERKSEAENPASPAKE